MRPFIVLVFALALFSSCSKLPIYKSENLNSSSGLEFQEITTNKFDKTNNVRYGIANNDTNFYVKAIFHDQQSLLKIMHGGLIIYFDPQGKKGKDYQLKIERTERAPMQSPGTAQQNMGSRENRMQNMPGAINKIFSKVTWIAKDKEFVFYRGLQKQTIEVELLPNEFNELVLLVKMPLAELPIPDNNLLSLGIETGSGSSGANKRAGSGMQASGRMGGGMGGGRGGMGGGGGRPRGNAPGGTSSSSSVSTIKIWFQVEL